MSALRCSDSSSSMSWFCVKCCLDPFQVSLRRKLQTYGVYGGFPALSRAHAGEKGRTKSVVHWLVTSVLSLFIPLPASPWFTASATTSSCVCAHAVAAYWPRMTFDVSGRGKLDHRASAGRRKTPVNRLLTRSLRAFQQAARPPARSSRLPRCRRDGGLRSSRRR